MRSLFVMKPKLEFQVR